MKNKIRWEIFERDKFTCQYCGRKPPEIILEIDHILPKSKGGNNEKINLITSCRECNRSKRDKILKNYNRTKIVKTELEDLKEAEEQIKEYYKYLKKITSYKKDNPIVNLIANTWKKEANGEYSLTEVGKKNIEKLLKKHSPTEIIEAIRIAWEASYVNPEEKFKYMCGVLRQFRLQKEKPEEAEKIKQNRKDYYELLYYWKNQPRGSGYLPFYKVKEWLEKGFTKEEIKRAMDEAKGMWTTLKEIINDKLN